MGDSILNGIQAIQAILAPALAISATALLMLSVSNRYSLTINRIRLLNEERRRYTIKITEKTELSYTEQMRFSNVRYQLVKLLKQCKELRNSIVLMQCSVALFVLSSISIAVNLFISSEFLRSLPVILFSMGMITLFAGLSYSAMDVINSYKLAKTEIKGDE